MLNNHSIHTFLAYTGSELSDNYGAMYPCSNPELIAAVSEAGGIGVIQPISLIYVHQYDFCEGIRTIKQLTDKPIGMNALIEKSSKRYHQCMVQLVQIALEEGIRFFVTSLSNPSWVLEMVHAGGGYVYHDVTEVKWALKGLDTGVDGLIAVNNRAEGYTETKITEQLINELTQFNVPIFCTAGISTAQEFQQMLNMGYAGIQMGTRFIASAECSTNYKKAIVNATEEGIVLSEKITGIPVSIIQTDFVKRNGVKTGIIS